jgi:hypothetical protein
MILGVDAEWLMGMCYSFKVSGFDGKTVRAAAKLHGLPQLQPIIKRFHIFFNWHVGIFLPKNVIF